MDTNGLLLSSVPATISVLESCCWFSRADSSHFAIISFCLITVDDTGHPPRIVESFVKSYFSANAVSASCLHYYDLTFSLEKPKLVKDFCRQAELMAEELIRFVSRAYHGYG